MNLLHLQYFYVVAKEQGFTRASEVLRIQQPAISRMVGQLEDSLGLKLFEKVGRNVQLTRQGVEVFESCKRIFGEVEALESSLGKISGEVKGPLVLAASEPIASHFIPAILDGYLQTHPQVYPSIFSGPSSMMFERMQKGEIEFGVFFHIPDLPEKLEIFEKIKFRYHLVVKKDSRRKKEVLQSFIGSREVDDTSTRRFPTLERLRKDYPEAKITISSNNLTSHREMVLRGMGVSILPEFLIKEDFKKGLIADVYPQEKFEFDMKFIKRKSSVFSLAALKFLEAAKVGLG